MNHSSGVERSGAGVGAGVGTRGAVLAPGSAARSSLRIGSRGDSPPPSSPRGLGGTLGPAARPRQPVACAAGTSRSTAGTAAADRPRHRGPPCSLMSGTEFGWILRMTAMENSGVPTSAARTSLSRPSRYHSRMYRGEKMPVACCTPRTVTVTTKPVNQTTAAIEAETIAVAVLTDPDADTRTHGSPWGAGRPMEPRQTRSPHRTARAMPKPWVTMRVGIDGQECGPAPPRRSVQGCPHRQPKTGERFEETDLDGPVHGLATARDPELAVDRHDLRLDRVP